MAKKAPKKTHRSATSKLARNKGKKIQKRNNTPRLRPKQLKQKNPTDSLKILIDCKKSGFSASVFKALNNYMGIFKRTSSIKVADIVITDKPAVKLKAIQGMHKGTVILIVPEKGTEKASVVNSTKGKKVRVFHMQERLIRLVILGIALQS